MFRKIEVCVSNSHYNAEKCMISEVFREKGNGRE